MPRTKLVVNPFRRISRKQGSAFDLSIAIGTLGATGQLPDPELLTKYVIMGS